MLLDTQKLNLLGVYSASPQLLKERNEIIKFYNFYEGPAKTPELALQELTQGQSWFDDGGLDYKPSQDIRNHTKKLIQKQARFMFGKSPNILLKPLDKGNKNKAEDKRMVLDNILDEANFWGMTAKAFLDFSIGKRVLMVVVANPNEPIQYQYYTSLDFTYKTDPNNYNKLTEVIIAYCDETTSNMTPDKQLWERWKYFMKGKQCWLESGQYDGNGRAITLPELKNTLLDELPCKVLLNGGLTGDVTGESDVLELMGLQNAYNKVSSDYRDALRFRMFEQSVFIDADSSSLESIKIAPGAIIDLKTDPATDDGGRADAKTLSSSFSFTEGADSYLDRAKSDMYELMDQPRPEDLREVPSAKALKFMFYDLMARCEEKWQEWGPAIKWMIRFTFKTIDQFNLYPELGAKALAVVPTNIIISPNYPIPEDEETQKGTAMKEVEHQVRSHKSYIKDFSDIEDQDGEWAEIIAEATELTTSADSLSLGMGAGVVDDGTDGKGNPKVPTKPKDKGVEGE